jgi:hypothetical protein
MASDPPPAGTEHQDIELARVSQAIFGKATAGRQTLQSIASIVSDFSATHDAESASACFRGIKPAHEEAAW